MPWESIFALNLRSSVICWVWGPVLAKFTPLRVHSVDSWTPAPSTWDGPLVSFFIQPEITKEGPTRETHILAGSSMEGKTSKAERELLEEPWPWLAGVMWGDPCWNSGKCYWCLSEGVDIEHSCELRLLATSGFPRHTVWELLSQKQHLQRWRQRARSQRSKGFLDVLDGSFSFMLKSLVTQTRQETQIQSLGQEDPLEKGMATHSSILAWRIPWMEEPGGLQSMVS